MRVKLVLAKRNLTERQARAAPHYGVNTMETNHEKKYCVGDTVYYYTVLRQTDGFSAKVYILQSGKKKHLRIANKPNDPKNPYRSEEEYEAYVEKSIVRHNRKLAQKTVAELSSDGSLSLNEYYAKHKEAIAYIYGWKQGRKSTQGVYSGAIEHQIAPKFGGKPINEITVKDCMEALDECEKEAVHRSGSSGHSLLRKMWLHNVLLNVLRYAEARYHIKYNPLKSTTRIFQKQLRRRVREDRLKPKSIIIFQIRKLLKFVESNMEENGTYLIAAIMLFLGIRDSAAAGLRFCDLIKNSSGKFYSARIAMQTDESRKIILGQKTNQSFIMIPIIPELQSLIDKRRMFIAKEYSDKDSKPLEQFTIACKGRDIQTPCNLSDINAAMKKLFHEAGIDEETLIFPTLCMLSKEIEVDSPTAYLFRRCFISFLYDYAQMSDNEASYLAGHSQSKSSLAISINYSDDERQQALYEKMMLISEWIDPRKHVADVNGTNKHISCANTSETTINIDFEKGESIEVFMQTLEPYDQLEIVITSDVDIPLTHTVNLREFGRFHICGANISSSVYQTKEIDLSACSSEEMEAEHGKTEENIEDFLEEEYQEEINEKLAEKNFNYNDRDTDESIETTEFEPESDNGSNSDIYALINAEYRKKAEEIFSEDYSAYDDEGIYGNTEKIGHDVDEVYANYKDYKNKKSTTPLSPIDHIERIEEARKACTVESPEKLAILTAEGIGCVDTKSIDIDNIGKKGHQSTIKIQRMKNKTPLVMETYTTGQTLLCFSKFGYLYPLNTAILFPAPNLKILKSHGFFPSSYFLSGITQETTGGESVHDGEQISCFRAISKDHNTFKYIIAVSQNGSLIKYGIDTIIAWQENNTDVPINFFSHPADNRIVSSVLCNENSFIFILLSNDSVICKSVSDIPIYSFEKGGGINHLDLDESVKCRSAIICDAPSSSILLLFCNGFGQIECAERFIDSKMPMKIDIRKRGKKISNNYCSCILNFQEQGFLYIQNSIGRIVKIPAGKFPTMTVDDPAIPVIKDNGYLVTCAVWGDT